MVADLALKTLQGSEIKLSSVAGKNGLVIAMFSASCPISGKLAPETARLEASLKEQGVGMLLVNAPPGQKAEEITQFIADHKLVSLVATDADGKLARQLAATTTTEVFLLDAARTLVYRGALNDQYGLGYSKDMPQHHYLRDAVAAMLRGEPAEVVATSAPGCALDLPAQQGIASTPATYHRDIARIMQANCVECHHKGGVGPFALDSYDAVIEHAGEEAPHRRLVTHADQHLEGPVEGQARPQHNGQLGSEGQQVGLGRTSRVGHLVLTGAVATLLCLLLYIIYWLDHPFGYQVGVTPVPFEQSVQVFDSVDNGT